MAGTVVFLEIPQYIQFKLSVQKQCSYQAKWTKYESPNWAEIILHTHPFNVTTHTAKKIHDIMVIYSKILAIIFKTRPNID